MCRSSPCVHKRIWTIEEYDSKEPATLQDFDDMTTGNNSEQAQEIMGKSNVCNWLARA